MKTQRNILIAFILNLAFSVFECIGGIITGSVAIVSDSVHDLGDALSIGVSYFLEKKSRGKPDDRYTYGYVRFSVMGGIITILILMIGSVLVIIGAVQRILHPVKIDYSGMIRFAIAGVVLNALAAWFTREGDSINQKAVNLHMFEDVLGWAVVLVGAIIMKFTDLSVIDPLLSIGVALFILIHSVRTFREVLDLFLEKVPSGVSLDEIRNRVCAVDGVSDVHHIHVWSMDGYNKLATMHIVTDEPSSEIKRRIREALKAYGISHATLELESSDELCGEIDCRGCGDHPEDAGHHHGHHHEHYHEHHHEHHRE